MEPQGYTISLFASVKLTSRMENGLLGTLEDPVINLVLVCSLHSISTFLEF